jgi:sugar (pentulose or hexulose) kinase
VVSNRHIAVIDIGKTNKKVLIFDENLQLIDSAYQAFDEIIEGDIHLEQTTAAFTWFKKQLHSFAQTYDIACLSVTTHGATVMCIDRAGQLATPPVAYTTEASEDFRREFYETFGNREDLQRTTATAEIGSMINLGKLLFFLKKTYPTDFAKIDKILNYPQYFGYLFTGQIGADPTYMGCHSYLYDFSKKAYSDVAGKLGILDKLPAKIQKSWEVLGTVTPEISQETGLSEDCLVTMGIHDSNSSLLPYLVKGYQNFVLNSTGTWCVAMHPTDTVSFQQDELGKLVFFNLDAFFNPVKTSIFMGGLEFGTYKGILSDLHQSDRFPEFDPEIYRELIAKRECFILPSVVKGTGIFPDALPQVIENGQSYSLADIQNGSRCPELFQNYERTFATLILSLVLQTKSALEMVGFDGQGTIFTEGGFRNNRAYNALLASIYPNARTATTKMAEATAFGAAILGKAALDGTSPMETASCFEIEIMDVPEKPSFPGFAEYEAEFHRLLSK